MSEIITRRQFLKLSGYCSLTLAVGSCGRSQTAPGSFASGRYLEILPSDEVVVTVTESEMGQGIATGLSMLVAEELDADWSKIRCVMAPADRFYGSQATGSSSSMREDWLPVRRAAAAARQMLLSAASAKWNVSPQECSTRQGMIVHPPTGRTLTFGDVCLDAARLDVPDDVPLKHESQFQIIGTPRPQLSTPSKVDGAMIYCMDIRLPGMKFATVVHCPWFGGRLKDFDSAKVTARGVHRIFGIDSGIAIVADSSWAALQAAKSLEIEWDTTAVERTSDRELLDAFAREVGSTPLTAMQKGIVEPGSASLSATYELPFEAHLTLEPQCCTVDPRGQRYRVWVPTQAPSEVLEITVKNVLSPIGKFAYRVRQKLAGRSPADVEVNVTPLGGGFGRRLHTDIVAEAIQVAGEVGGPVNLFWSREEDLQHDYYRPASYHELKATVADDGGIGAWQHTIVGPSIKAANDPDFPAGSIDATLMDGIAPPMYPADSISVGWVPHVTPVPIGPWRSVGASSNGFVVESFVDEIAHHLDMDPFALRRDLLRGNARATRVLEEVATLSDWSGSSPGSQGMAIFESFHSCVAEVVHLDRRDGQWVVSRVDCVIDCGLAVNPLSIEAQLQGAILFALTAATCSKATILDGRVAQSNFHDYRVARLADAPEIRVKILSSAAPPTGVGEPAVPPLAPALANAVFRATGKRVRSLPIELEALG